MKVTKRIWAYIKEKSLQNPEDRRVILCDDKLKALFKKKSIMMFEMTKNLSQVFFCFVLFLPIWKYFHSRITDVAVDDVSL